jgi:hypothetical protein
MKLIGLVLRGARYKDEILEIGDLAIHDEEAFPDETFASRTSSVSAFELAGLTGPKPPPLGSESPPAGER